jgi:cytochrome c-type biogenesis protein CcmI
VIAVIVLASALLTAVAAAGVLRPFLANRRVVAEPGDDPLEDERRSLFRALRDLEEDRASGRLPEDTYRDLRTETEARAVAVLRALEHRDGQGDLASGLQELRERQPEPRAPGRRAVTAAVAVAVAAVVVAPLLGGALRGRDAGSPITGDVGGVSALAFFEGRVQEHPDDLAARLDLAEAYAAQGNVKGALNQYVAALEIDPRSAEAHAQVGALLFRLGRRHGGLAEVNRALEIDPRYPVALYYRGAILDSLGRDRSAAAAYREYLDAAPFGAHRDEVRERLDAMRG